MPLSKSITFQIRCKCGNCSTELLQNPKECLCCVEFDSCVEALNSDKVINEVTYPPTCVTRHPGFEPVCLQIWSLRLDGRKYMRIDWTRYHQSGSENRYNFNNYTVSYTMSCTCRNEWFNNRLFQT